MYNHGWPRTDVELGIVCKGHEAGFFEPCTPITQYSLKPPPLCVVCEWPHTLDQWVCILEMLLIESSLPVLPIPAPEK
jgi:hypothetical protein